MAEGRTSLHPAPGFTKSRTVMSLVRRLERLNDKAKSNLTTSALNLDRIGGGNGIYPLFVVGAGAKRFDQLPQRKQHLFIMALLGNPGILHLPRERTIQGDQLELPQIPARNAGCFVV